MSKTPPKLYEENVFTDIDLSPLTKQEVSLIEGELSLDVDSLATKALQRLYELYQFKIRWKQTFC